MKSRVCTVMLASLAMALGIIGVGKLIDREGPWTTAAQAAAPVSPAGAKPSALPALEVKKDAPLLLLDEPAKPKAGSKPGEKKKVADNESCYVCHGDYREEPMAQSHAKENIGCIKCHGESHAHRDDEDNITPPDIMFAHEQIDPACAKCHEDHNAPARKVIARWQQRCPQKSDPRQVVCTDCHGQHRRPFRTVVWDKKTGKVLMQKEAAGKAAPAKKE
jgi:hypothetical protein